MTISYTHIGRGTSANDGTGTPARDGAQIINDNFDAIAALINAGQLQGSKNRLFNGCGAINQRGAASNADDTYGPDRWNILTQTGAVAVTILTDPENGAATGIRLTQSQASAQRMGIAQIVESLNCRDLRAAITTLAGRVRLSSSADVRYAVLEWTGTADTVTSDVVADWTSASYTAGGFFNSTTLNVLAVGEVACTAATWRALTALNATLGSSANNIIVFVWTEGTVAQNVTLDINRVQWEAGATATPYDRVELGAELARCRRYYEKSFPLETAPVQAVGVGIGGHVRAPAVIAGATVNRLAALSYQVEKRANPTVTIYNPVNANAQVYDQTAAADCSSTSVASIGRGNLFITTTANAGSVVGGSLIYHWAAESEL